MYDWLLGLISEILVVDLGSWFATPQFTLLLVDHAIEVTPLAIINSVACVVMGVHAICCLLVQKWRIWQPAMWAYLIIFGGAMWTMLQGLHGVGSLGSEVSTNVGFSMLIVVHWLNFRWGFHLATSEHERAKYGGQSNTTPVE